MGPAPSNGTLGNGALNGAHANGAGGFGRDGHHEEPGDAHDTPAGQMRPTYTPHPLFELADGEQEYRDIQTLSFKRKNSEGKLITHPEIIQARDVKSWADVARWWGGGYYKVSARNATGHFAGQFPRGEDLHYIDGPEKPFTVRESAASAPAPSAASAPAPLPPAAPSAAAPPAPPPDPMQMMKDFARELLVPIRDELRELRAAAPAAAPAKDSGVEMMIAMFKLQGEEARARADQAAADAKARAESEAARAKADAELAAAKAKADADVRIAEINAATASQNNMWTAMNKGGGTKGGEESSLVALLLKMIPAPMDPLALMKAAREAAAPVAAAESDPLKSLTDMMSTMITADAMKPQPQAQPAAPPQPREEARPRGQMAYVPGVGVVEVHAPEHVVHRDAASAPAPATPAAAAPPSAAVAASPPVAPAPPPAAPPSPSDPAPPPVAPPPLPDAAASLPDAAAPPVPGAPVMVAASPPADGVVAAPARVVAQAAEATAAPSAPAADPPAATVAPVAEPLPAVVAAEAPRPGGADPKPTPSLAEMRAELSGLLRDMKAKSEEQRVAFLLTIPPFAAQAKTLAPVLGALSDTDIDNITAHIGVAELQGIVALRPNGIARHGG